MNNAYPGNTVQRVYELLDAKHMTIYQLERISGVSHSSIKNAEKRGGQLTVDTIYRICQVLGISMSEFFSEYTEPNAIEFTTISSA